MRLDHNEIETLRAHAWFMASDANGETSPPNPGKAERWAAIGRKLDAELQQPTSPSQEDGQHAEEIARYFEGPARECDGLAAESREAREPGGEGLEGKADGYRDSAEHDMLPRAIEMAREIRRGEAEYSPSEVYKASCGRADVYRHACREAGWVVPAATQRAPAVCDVCGYDFEADAPRRSVGEGRDGYAVLHDGLTDEERRAVAWCLG